MSYTVLALLCVYFKYQKKLILVQYIASRNMMNEYSTESTNKNIRTVYYSDPEPALSCEYRHTFICCAVTSGVSS